MIPYLLYEYNFYAINCTIKNLRHSYVNFILYDYENPPVAPTLFASFMK